MGMTLTFPDKQRAREFADVFDEQFAERFGLLVLIMDSGRRRSDIVSDNVVWIGKNGPDTNFPMSRHWIINELAQQFSGTWSDAPTVDKVVTALLGVNTEQQIVQRFEEKIEEVFADCGLSEAEQMTAFERARQMIRAVHEAFEQMHADHATLIGRMKVWGGGRVVIPKNALKDLVDEVKRDPTTLNKKNLRRVTGMLIAAAPDYRGTTADVQAELQIERDDHMSNVSTLKTIKYREQQLRTALLQYLEDDDGYLLGIRDIVDDFIREHWGGAKSDLTGSKDGRRALNELLINMPEDPEERWGLEDQAARRAEERTDALCKIAHLPHAQLLELADRIDQRHVVIVAEMKCDR